MLRLATALFLIGQTAAAAQAPLAARAGAILPGHQLTGVVRYSETPGHPAAPADAGSQAVEPSPFPTISQGARLWWDQGVGPNLTISAHRFQLVVDGAPAGSLDASCESIGQGDFTCSAILPRLEPGIRQLTVAASAAGQPESLSAPLDVRVAGSDPAPTPGEGTPPPEPGEAFPVQTVTALLLPDQRTLVGDRSGRIFLRHPEADSAAQVLAVDDITTGDGRGLLALAAGPDVADTGTVFALYTTSGGLRITRFQLVGDVLTAPATVLDGLPMAELDPRAALSVGPDGMLYVALGETGDAGQAGDRGNWAGKLLRFAPDGTTPRDQRSGSPVIVDALRAPEGIAWTGPGDVWISDLRSDTGLTVVHAVRTLDVWFDQTFAVTVPASTRTHGLVIAENGSIWSTVVATDGRQQALLHLTASSEREMASALEPLEDQVSAFSLPTADHTTYAWTSRGLLGGTATPR